MVKSVGAISCGCPCYSNTFCAINTLKIRQNKDVALQKGQLKKRLHKNCQTSKISSWKVVAVISFWIAKNPTYCCGFLRKRRSTTIKTTLLLLLFGTRNLISIAPTIIFEEPTIMSLSNYAPHSIGRQAAYVTKRRLID